MSARKFIKEIIQDLKPGEEQRIDALLFDWPTFPPATEIDDIFGGILGSAYEYSWSLDELDRIITVRRRKEPLTREQINNGLRCSVSSDRLCYFNKRIDGLYELKQ